MVVEATGVSRRTITRLRSGSTPDTATLGSVVVGIARLCRQAFDSAGSDADLSDLAARCSAQTPGSQSPLCSPLGGKRDEVDGRERVESIFAVVVGFAATLDLLLYGPRLAIVAPCRSRRRGL